MKRFQMFLPEQMLKRLEKMSRKGGLSVAEIIRRAIDQFLSAEDF